MVARELEHSSVQEASRTTSRTSLHSALRRALQTEEDWPLIAYRNHREIEMFVGRFYECLNDRVGSRVDLLTLKNSIDIDAVVGLLRITGKELNLGEPPDPVQRPGLKKVQGSGKYRSVIAAEVAAIAHVRSRNFADVMGDFLVPGESNREMIERIDHSLVKIGNEREVNWDLAKTFSQAVMTWMKTSESSLVSDFCVSLFDEWGGVTDGDLLRRLEIVAPKGKSAVSG